MQIFYRNQTPPWLASRFDDAFYAGLNLVTALVFIPAEAPAGEKVGLLCFHFNIFKGINI